MSNPMQLMQWFQQFAANNREDTAEMQVRQIMQGANLNQRQLNKIQTTANMLYGMAQRFGLIK